MTLAAQGFRHEALLHAGPGDFVERAAPVVAGAVDAGEPVLVAVGAAKIELLRERLGRASRSVAWKDIRGIGGNPARIIPLWREFVDRHRPRGRLWGFGEPVWPGREPAELVEAHRHEQLLNLAFAGVPGFTLLCPYDTERLDPAVLHQCRRNHPFVADGFGERMSADYPGLAAVSAFDAPLPEPPAEAAELAVDGDGIEGVRRFVTGIAPDLARADDLTLAVLAVARAMGHPGAPDRVRVWSEPRAILAELRDLTPVDDPLAGREWPAPSGGPARGLWLANQLCDLVQLRSSGAGATVRLHVACGTAR